MLLARTQTIINILSALGILVALYLVFIFVPNERIMGPVQRIFYFHVSSAIASYCAIVVMLIAALWLLIKNKLSLGPVVLAGSEIAFVFCSITLFTGMTWGDAAWNTPFRFEPRLVSFLLLWLILFSTQMIKFFMDGDKLYILASVFAVVAAMSIPLVIFSVKLLPASVQLHPQVLGNKGLEFPGFKWTFLTSLFSIIALQFALLLLRARLGLLEHKVRFLESRNS
jgi:heme exporter protein C